MVRCKNCIKNAYYNNNEEEIPLYCKNHKLENMVNIKRKKCIHEVRRHYRSTLHGRYL